VILAALVFCAAAIPGLAETLRIATYHTELSRKGPGLLLRDILRGEDAQVEAVAQVVGAVSPDILILQGVDYDRDLLALAALRDVIAKTGPHYPHLFALRPNTGLASGLDVDGDGKLGEPEDAQGYGWFAGEGGMAILSRHPLATDAVQDFSAMLWADLPGAIPPPGMAEELRAGLRLSTTGHWVVPVRMESGLLHLLTFHAGPPVFDGPEDRNGRRNHDEIVFWRQYLNGAFGPASKARFVLAGDANLDPVDSEGRKVAIRALLEDKRLQDPAPRRSGPAPEDDVQRGDPALDTAAWSGPKPGHLRVSYILPSADLTVTRSGVFWPAEGAPLAEVAARASRHRMVWVDLAIE